MAHGVMRTDRQTQLASMGAVGTLFSIVNRTSNATSQNEWHLYRKTTDKRRVYGPAEDTRTEVTRHLALQVWEKPNPFMTRQEFVETFMQHLDLCGEAWWLVERIEGTKIPRALWPLRPDRMVPVPHPTEFLSGYVYLSPDGEKIPLDLDEVVFLRMPNPEDPYRGMGPVQSILTELESTKLASTWHRNFFLNSAAPGGIIEVPESLSDPEFKELQTRWREQHQGVANAHRVAILERATWKDRSHTMRDMQFVELREVSRETIREAFGYPKPMLGAVDDINRANAEAGEVVFARWLIVPRLERIKQALNNDFLPLFGSTGVAVEFDYDNPVPDDLDRNAADRTSKTTAVSALVSAGYHPEDVLEAVGLPPMRYVGGERGTREEPAEHEPDEDEQAGGEAA